jgi:hypothetical protein
LYADELDVAAHGPPPADPTRYDVPPVYTGNEGDDTDDRDDVARGAAAWLPWVIVALAMVLVAVGGVWLLTSPDDDASEPPSRSDSPSATQETTADDSPTDGEPTPSSSEPEPSSSAPAPAGDPVDVASTAAASAPSTAPPNADAFGNRTTYTAANMLDGLAETCWRMAGDGTGVELTFQLASPTAMTRVGMINGYAKNAVVGGRNLNWYVGNRRVLSAQWVFDDGTTVDQPLGATKQMQTIDLGAPVTTSSVTLRLVAVSSPGTGRSARNYTAVSEVTLVGIPSA